MQKEFAKISIVRQIVRSRFFWICGLWAVGLILIFSFAVTKHQGCLDKYGCSGPRGEYYMVFVSELDFLGGYAFYSVLVSLILFPLFVFFRFFRKERKNSIGIVKSLVVSVLLGVSFFLFLTLLFPIIVVY